MSVLRVTDLHVRYPAGVHAVRGARLAVRRGEVLGLVGASGSGKTALALAVMGLLPEGARATGSVLLGGRELLGRPDAELSRVRGGDLAMVFQDPVSALTPVRTIGDQLAECVRIHARVSRRAARARAAELLGRAGIPDARRVARAYPHELSGGMRQRAVIAAAIAHDPAVIVADEPTTALDATVRASVLETLCTAGKAGGAAVVLISHDPDVISGVADRVVVMRAGRTEEAGRPEIFRRLRNAPAVRPRSGVSAGSRRAERPTVLEVSGLVRHHVPPGLLRSRRTGVVRAVDGITFDVREGETLALVGESGSGKTTTLTEILRLSRPQGGRVTVLGRDTATLRAPDRKALRREVQAVFQDPSSSLNPRMRVADILSEPLTAHGVSKVRARTRVAELMELVGLEPGHAQRHPHALSGGQRQRVGIARALALDPRLLLLDEPVTALDAAARAEVVALLERLRDRLGMACLIVTHDLGLVRRLADRVAVMHAGRIVEIGSVGDVCGAPAHPYTRALLDAVPAAGSRPGRHGVRAVLRGDPSDPPPPPGGCTFRSRCPRPVALTAPVTFTAAEEALCEEHDPKLRPVHPGDDADHSVACHHSLVRAVERR